MNLFSTQKIVNSETRTGFAKTPTQAKIYSSQTKSKRLSGDQRTGNSEQPRRMSSRPVHRKIMPDGRPFVPPTKSQPKNVDAHISATPTSGPLGDNTNCSNNTTSDSPRPSLVVNGVTGSRRRSLKRTVKTDIWSPGVLSKTPPTEKSISEDTCNKDVLSDNKALLSDPSVPDASMGTDADSLNVSDHAHPSKSRIMLSPRVVTPPSPSDEEKEFESSEEINRASIKKKLQKRASSRRRGKRVTFEASKRIRRSKSKHGKDKEASFKTINYSNIPQDNQRATNMDSYSKQPKEGRKKKACQSTESVSIVVT